MKSGFHNYRSAGPADCRSKIGTDSYISTEQAQNFQNYALGMSGSNDYLHRIYSVIGHHKQLRDDFKPMKKVV